MYKKLIHSKRFLLAAIVTIVASIITLPAIAASWRSYHNTRFGVTGDVPSNWKMQAPPQNNDGRAFASPDGKAMIIISGIFSVSPHNEEIADRLKSDDGETVTTSSSDATHVRIQGTKGDDAFVRVSLLGCSGKIWNDLTITYPQKEEAKFRSIVDHVAASLHAGQGYEMTCK